jgi:sterol 3beta-glucosyltransferase
MGDVMPCAALGGGLARAGHTVRLASFENFAGLAQRYQLAFTRVSGDAQAMVQAAGPNLARILFQFLGLARQYSRDFSAPELLETDLILNQLPGGLFGWDLAEKAGVPMLALAYLPLQATSAYPMMAYPRLFSRLPGYNRLTYRIAEQSVWQFFRGPVNRWRREVLGLPAQKPGGRFSELGTTACPWIMGASPQLIPPQADWPPEVYFTGYWYPQEEDWQPPADLARFLEAGPAPVFIGFGSMPVGDSLRVTQMIISAVDQAGLRAVLHAGWSGLGDLRLPENILRIDYAPYEWLFPRMAGLVIHGGAGSVHFAARSGVSALVVPFVFDQFVWGRRFAAIGSGPPPLPFRRLTAERLASALHTLVNDVPMRAAAARLGNAVWQEAGIPAAVELIETIYARTPAPGRGQPLKVASAAGRSS